MRESVQDGDGGLREEETLSSSVYFLGFSMIFTFTVVICLSWEVKSVFLQPNITQYRGEFPSCSTKVLWGLRNFLA